MKKWGFALSASFAANHRQVLEISQELEILLTKDKISLQKSFFYATYSVNIEIYQTSGHSKNAIAVRTEHREAPFFIEPEELL